MRPLEPETAPLPIGQVKLGTSPLIERSLSDPFACRSSSDGLVYISCAQLLADASVLAQQIGEHKHILNLCQSRYEFCRSFIAAIMHGACTLLPQNHRVGTQNALVDKYADTLIVHDGLKELSTVCKHIDVSSISGEASSAEPIPDIPFDQLVAIAFTSGSTGEPKGNQKYWRTFYESSRINSAHMLSGLDLGSQHVFHMLATVPAQHMWGLETSVLLPMFNPICVHDARPLFPKDVADTLSAMPEPRLMVSTPVHLRALIASQLPLSQTQRVLCATAPLAAELAEQVELALHASVREVYGCSEVGSMAYREPVREQSWRIFSGLNFKQGSSSEFIEVSAAHLTDPVGLSDKLQLQEGATFRLLGRDDDMLEIAGKRGSLQAMNHMVLSLAGVIDAVVFVPENQKSKVSRTAALVVTDGSQTAASILEHLAQNLDPVFLPRPLKLVEALPRESNGKLPTAKLNAYFRTLR